MARRDKSALHFDAVRVEGAIIQPDIVDRAGAGAAEGQSAESYGLDRGLMLRDEIGRAYKIAKGSWATFNEGAAAANRHAVHRALAVGILTRVLGFEISPKRRYVSRSGAEFDLVTAGASLAPIAIAGAEGLDHVETIDIAGADPIRRSATTLVQSEVNAREGSLWGIVTNGVAWRLLRDNESITRPGYIEIDLARILRDDLYADFSAFWLIAHRSRFPQEGATSSDCALERWRQIGRDQGVTVRDELRDGVQKALFHFGRGFLENPANSALVARVNGEGVSRLTGEDFFRQLLRMVYRLILIMTAEDREILHPETADERAKATYANGYATGRLRECSRNRLAWDRHHDAYEGMKVVFEALARGEPKLALPALGGLFAADQMRDLEQARLTNKRFLNGFYHLAWLRRDGALARINWRDMETEEFGSVYESLLELTPVISNGGRYFAFVGEADEDATDNRATKPGKGKAAKGNERKTTGSYYTPDALVQLLLKEALDPVIDRKVAENPGDPEALLSLKVIDPACGSGHFLLGAARKIARRLAEARHAGAPTIAQYRHALREVARFCIHGVDRNEMAVELTKVALWIETIEPGRPLGFLDVNIRCGDSLLGIFDLEALRQGIPDEAYKPLTGDDKETAKHFAARNRADKVGQGTLDFGGLLNALPPPPPLADTSRALRALPEDSLDQIAEKQRRVRAAEADPARWRWRVAADLYVAAFLTPKTGGVPANRNTVTIPTTEHVWAELSGRTVYGPLIGRAQDVAGEAWAFHWPLEFPEAFAAGGFDVVVGNPPWERIKLEEQEFFASRDEEISTAPNAAARSRLIVLLRSAAQGSRDRALYHEFEAAKRSADASSLFARLSGNDHGRFPFTGRGDVNTYALFAELFSALPNALGRSGVIVPTGIATDLSTSNFFSNLVTNGRLLRLYDFQTGMGFFDHIGHARFKFCLMTIGQRVLHERKDPEFAFFLRRIKDLEQQDRFFSLSANDILKMNPNTKTAPVFRSRVDAELMRRLYAHTPILAGETRNPWGLKFATVFHMSNDSGLFRTASQLSAAGGIRHGMEWEVPGAVIPSDRGRWIPIYEAKMVNQFDHRWATYDEGSAGDDDARYPTSAEKLDADFEIGARYWSHAKEVSTRISGIGWNRDWLCGWRDITNAGNERTVIGSAFPLCGVGNSLPVWLPSTSIEPRKLASFIANLSSLTLDYIARLKVGGTHLNFFIAKQIAVIPPSTYSDADLVFIAPRVLELVYTSYSMSPFARDLGYDGPPFAWNEDRRAWLRAELDAFYARAYGLTRDELRYILDPADVMGADYPSETFRVLKENEIRRYGEFRTRRLVLEAWDQQAALRAAA